MDTRCPRAPAPLRLTITCLLVALLCGAAMFGATSAGAASICPAGYFDEKLHGTNGCLCGGYEKGVAFYPVGSKSKCGCAMPSTPGYGYQVTPPFCVACAAAKFNAQTGKLIVGFLQNNATCTLGTYSCPNKGEKPAATLWGVANKEGPPTISCASVCKGGMVYNMAARAFADPTNCSCPKFTHYLNGKCVKVQLQPPPVASKTKRS